MPKPKQNQKFLTLLFLAFASAGILILYFASAAPKAATSVNQGVLLMRAIDIGSALKNINPNIPGVLNTWPQVIPFEGTCDYYFGGQRPCWSGWTEPVVAEIDGSSKGKEVIVYTFAPVPYNPKIRMFSSDANKLWQTEVDNGCGNDSRLRDMIIQTPVIGDIDADGRKETFIFSKNCDNANNSEIVALNSNGQMLSGWPAELPKLNPKNVDMLLADIDNDGKKELVIKTHQYAYQPETPFKLLILNHRGEIILNSTFPGAGGSPGWFVDPISAPAVGNFDNDVDLEIVFTTLEVNYENPDKPQYSGKIYVLNKDGSVISGWPVHWGSYIWASSPTVGDIDANGREDIIIGGILGDGGLYAYNADGSLMSGWPRYKAVNERGGGQFWAGSALTNFGQGKPSRIAAASYIFNQADLNAHLLNHSGDNISGWPRTIGCYGSIGSMTAADINGDGKDDVMMNEYEPSGNGTCGIQAWQLDGSAVGGYPKNSQALLMAGPTVIDLRGGVQSIDNL